MPTPDVIGGWLLAMPHRLAASTAFWVVVVFAACATLVQLRGRVRLKLRRQLFDHSTFLAPYNIAAYAFSAVESTPYIDVARFPELKVLADNWQVIRDEALKLEDEGMVRAALKGDDAGFRTFFKRGWRRFYVKWYDEALPSARALCPRTVELVAAIPTMNAAMFTLLPAGARLGLHRDPLAASLRYHLGLATPNSDDCWISVDGQRHAWRDGQGVVFDETYVHEASNATDRDRLILLCDIERPFNNPVMRAINRTLGHALVRAGASPNVEGERTGVLSHVAKGVHQVQAFGQRIKAWNYPVYFVLKNGLILLLLWWVFF